MADENDQDGRSAEPDEFSLSGCPGGKSWTTYLIVTRVANIFPVSMVSQWSKVIVIPAIVFVVSVADTALAQGNIPSIMVDVDKNGIPIIMKDPDARPKRAESEDRQSKRAERPRKRPRGSSAYVEPIPLPNTSRASGIVAPPPVTPFNPPPINNPSERINQLNHSFPLNRGLGNNPTDRDAYIRYNLNR